MFAGRNIEHIRQIPEKLLDVTLQPLMFVLLFAYVFGGAIDVGGGNYREYIIAGILMQSLAFGLTGPATSIATDLTEGVIDRFRSLPATRIAYRRRALPRRARGHGAVDRRPARRRAARRLARAHRRPRTSRPRWLLLLAFSSAMIWIGTWIGLMVRVARRGHGRRLRRRVPAHVPQQRVRADRLAARPCCSGSRRGTRSA